MPHTPGPWTFGHWGNHEQVYVHPVDPNGADIAHCGMMDRPRRPFEEELDNARLIAAAPQMLAALKAAWFAIDPETHPDQNRMVRAAIDAAEGKTNG